MSLNWFACCPDFFVVRPCPLASGWLGQQLEFSKDALD
jgi:hypothetical protein